MLPFLVRSMKPLQAKLWAHRPSLLQIAQRYGVSNLRVFGSVARGEEQQRSDIDLLVDPGPETTLFDLAAMLDEVEALLGEPVDLVTPSGLSPRFRERVLDEAVAL